MTTELNLSQRIEKLERSNTRLKWVTGLSLLFLIIVVAIGQLNNKNSVEVQELRLRDKSGNIVARLGSQRLGTCLEIFGATKATGAELCVGDNYGASFALTNHLNESVAYLSAGSRIYGGVETSWPPQLVISDQNGKNFIHATIGADTKLVVGHGTEENAFVVSTIDTKPTLSLFGDRGIKQWTAP